VLNPLLEQKDSLPLAYDFDLMEGSGHITVISSKKLKH
jgi:hypothetical protein